MFDFTPGETSATTFLASQAIRWAGYLLFVAVAWMLGRRVDDWRIPVLAVAALLLPAVWSDLTSTVHLARLEAGDAASTGEVWAVVSVVGYVLELSLLGVLIAFSARAVARRRVDRARVQR